MRLPDPGPKAKARAPADLPRDVIVHVAANGVLSINDAPLTEAELIDKLTRLADLMRKQSVIIAGDRDTLHKYVVKVLNACYRAGITDISFAALKGE